MINANFNILNQLGTPMFYSDVFANRPSAGIVGRMFIATDTFAFYRDTGTGWDLIGGPGTGTITGSGASGQVSFFSGASTIGGSNNLFWDSANNRLGIGTATPGVPLDIHTTGTGITINGTTTNNSFATFQNAGTGKWRIGNNYNAGNNYFSIYDVSSTVERLKITNTGSAIFASDVSGYAASFASLSITASNGVAGGFVNNANGFETINVKNLGLGKLASFLNTGGEVSYINNDGSVSFYIPAKATAGTIFLTTDSGVINSRTAAQVLTDIGAASASSLSNYLPLTGGTLTGALNCTTISATGLFSYQLKGRLSDNFGSIGFYNNSGATRYGYIQSGSTNGGQINITGDGGGNIILDSNGVTSVYKMTATAFIPSGSTIPSNGMYLSAANQIAFATNTTNAAYIDSTQNLLIGTTQNGGLANAVNIGNTSTLSATSGTKLRVAGDLEINSLSTAGSGDINNLYFRKSHPLGINIVNYDLGIIRSYTNGGYAGGLDFYTGKSVGGGSYAATFAMRISDTQELLVGTTTDNGAYNIQCNGTAVWGAGAYVNGSDIRLKENVLPILSGLKYVEKMKPVSYKYIDSYSKDQDIQTGFIAQDLLEVFKDEIWVNGIVKEGKEFYNVAYQNIIPILTKAIQELKAEIDNLKN